MSKNSELEKLILKWNLLQSLICKSLKEEAMRMRWGGEREKGRMKKNNINVIHTSQLNFLQ